MTAFTKKFRGQNVQIAGDRCHIRIRTAQAQHGGPPTVGLSDALLTYAHNKGKTIYVTVDFPKSSFKTTSLEWANGALKEEQASYYNIPWYIYRKAIPKEAFQLNPSSSSAPKEMDEKTRFYQGYSFL